MRHEDVTEDEMARAIDAYPHHLAERIRATRDHARGATTGTAIVDFAADLIDPAVKR
jgi:hypothetical protein